MPQIADAIRDAIALEAVRQHEDAQSLSYACEGKITPDHIERFLTGRCGMNTHKATRLLKALGLTIHTPRSHDRTSHH